jgi:hypothetical protein
MAEGRGLNGTGLALEGSRGGTALGVFSLVA